MTHGKNKPRPTLRDMAAKFEETNAETLRQAEAAYRVTMDQYVLKLERALSELYYQRRARVIEGDNAWCAGCGRVSVDCSTGTDVCPACLPRVSAARGLP